MALHTGLAVNSISIDAPDVRLGQAGLVMRDIDGVPRSGIFPTSTTALVTARTDMQVNVAAFAAAFSRGAGYGVVLFGNDGSTISPALAAPTANAWIYTLYVAVPDTTSGDAAAVPSFQVVRGAASATPTAPAVPAGGLPIATIRVPSTATTTASANVVITPTFSFTAAAGGVLDVRDQTERDALRVMESTTIWRLDKRWAEVWNGRGWEVVGRHAERDPKVFVNTGYIGGGQVLGSITVASQPQAQRVHFEIGGLLSPSSQGDCGLNVTTSAGSVTQNPQIRIFNTIGQQWYGYARRGHVDIPANVAATISLVNEGSVTAAYQVTAEFHVVAAGQY